MDHAKPIEVIAEGATGENTVKSPEAAHFFSLFAVFRVSSSHPQTFDGRDVAGAVHEIEDVIQEIADVNVTLRGWYDVSGMRSDADVMVWLHGGSAEDLQWSLRQLRRTTLLSSLVRVWGAIGVYRESAHARVLAPGFVRGVESKMWISVGECSRTSQWHTLGRAEQTRVDSELERVVSQFDGVVQSAVVSCSLGDAECLVAREADDLTDLIDVARAVRQLGGVRGDERGPSFTGRRIETVEIVELVQ